MRVLSWTVQIQIDQSISKLVSWRDARIYVAGPFKAVSAEKLSCSMTCLNICQIYKVSCLPCSREWEQRNKALKDEKDMMVKHYQVRCAFACTRF